ncbi:MAG: glycosyltransferase [Actinobacteria bacterium]|nr:glycosyltransferase [Chloroflexota bacterium]MBE3129042.1 glycosyltransferase [Actinomycetota bacterium]
MLNWFKVNGFLNIKQNIDQNIYDVFVKSNLNCSPEYIRLAIVSFLPNKNTSELLKVCIKSIKKFTNNRYELWIVDNNSPLENIKWLNKINDVNLAFIRSNKEISGSFANALALEVAVRLINQDTKYFMSLHEDVIVCRIGWLDYLLSKFNKEVKAVGFRIVKRENIEEVLHVLGCIVDFQLFRNLKLSFFPDMPNFDVGDKVIYEIKRNGFKIFSTPNTYNNINLIEKIPDTIMAKSLNVDRAFNNKEEIIHMHLGRGVPKTVGNYNKLHSNKEKCTYLQWIDYADNYLFSKPFLQYVDEKEVDKYNFNETSITDFYNFSFYKEYLKYFKAGSKTIYNGQNPKVSEVVENKIHFFSFDDFNNNSVNKTFYNADCFIISKLYSNFDNMFTKIYSFLNKSGVLMISISPDSISESISLNKITDRLWEIGFREVSVRILGTDKSVLLGLKREKNASKNINNYIKKKLRRIIISDNKNINKINNTETLGYGITAVK